MFEDRTQENIKAEALAEIEPATGLSPMAGGFADAVIGPAARQVSELYQALPAVVSMLFVDETSGGYLDLVGSDYHNLTRRAGTKARCAVTLTGEAGAVIPAETVFLTAGGLRFVLLAQVTLGQNGTAVGQLEAAEVGEAYNIPPGSLTGMWVNLPGLESYVNTQAEGGTDDETDQQLYRRIDEARKRPTTSGNGWDWRRWAMEVEGVGEAKVVELAEGAGTVGVTLVDSAFAPASPEMVEAVEAHIMENKPVGAVPLVTAPGALTVTVAAAVTISASTTLDEVGRQFEEALETYVAGLIQAKYGQIYYGPEEDLPYTLVYNRVLAALLTIEGVTNFSTLTVNGGTADVTIQANQVPVLGEVSVT